MSSILTVTVRFDGTGVGVSKHRKLLGKGMLTYGTFFALRALFDTGGSNKCSLNIFKRMFFFRFITALTYNLMIRIISVYLFIYRICITAFSDVCGRHAVKIRTTCSTN